MSLSALGEVAQEEMETLSTHYRYVEVLMFVVMPNHVHAILHIKTTGKEELPARRPRLGVVIGGYKQKVTMYARLHNMEFGWQERYHDHIIRNERDGNNIAQYIETNVARWESDLYH